MIRSIPRPAGRPVPRTRVGRGAFRGVHALCTLALLTTALPPIRAVAGAARVLEVPPEAAVVAGVDALPAEAYQLAPATGWTAPGVESRETTDRFQQDRRTRVRSLTGPAAPPPLQSRRVRASAARTLAVRPRTDTGHAHLVREGHVSIPPPHALSS